MKCFQCKKASYRSFFDNSMSQIMRGELYCKPNSWTYKKTVVLKDSCESFELADKETIEKREKFLKEKLSIPKRLINA